VGIPARTTICETTAIQGSNPTVPLKSKMVVWASLPALPLDKPLRFKDVIQRSLQKAIW
jgi:hypothetical protein